MKCCTVPGPSTATVLPLSSLIDAILPRTAMPSPPFDLSISSTCTVGIPAEVQTMCWSTVVAAALSAPAASAAERCTGGIMRISTSAPFFLKIPALSASESGAKPVQPLIPSTTFSCAAAVPATASDASSTRTNVLMAGSPSEGRSILAADGMIATVMNCRSGIALSRSESA